MLTTTQSLRSNGTQFGIDEDDPEIVKDFKEGYASLVSDYPHELLKLSDIADVLGTSMGELCHLLCEGDGPEIHTNVHGNEFLLFLDLMTWLDDIRTWDRLDYLVQKFH